MCDKIAYAYPDDARKHARSIDGSVYHCPQCLMFHVTSGKRSNLKRYAKRQAKEWNKRLISGEFVYRRLSP